MALSDHISFQESTSVGDPHLHLMSVIVAVLCLVILASCITIFLIWRRYISHLIHLIHLSRISISLNVLRFLFDASHPSKKPLSDIPSQRKPNHSPYPPINVLLSPSLLALLIIQS